MTSPFSCLTFQRSPSGMMWMSGMSRRLPASGPGLTGGQLRSCTQLRAQERDDVLQDAVRRVQRGIVAAALEHDDLRPREALALALGVFDADEAVVRAPEHERRAVERLQDRRQPGER